MLIKNYISQSHNITNMYLIKQLSQYDKKCIYFGEPIKNNIVCDGNFIRLLYSSDTIVLNGVYLEVNLSEPLLEKHYNKRKCVFSTLNNEGLITKLSDIELNLLNLINMPEKTKHCKLLEQLNSGCVKFICENTQPRKSRLILKISGIWETEHDYGLTFKFMVLLNNTNVS